MVLSPLWTLPGQLTVSWLFYNGAWKTLAAEKRRPLQSPIQKMGLQTAIDVQSGTPPRTWNG